MSIFKKTVSLMPAAALALIISGCVSTDDLGESESGSNGTNKTTLETGTDANGFQTFTITLEVKDVGGDYYHVNYSLEHDGNTPLLSYGANYEGTVITSCSPNGSYGSDYINYACTTHYDTKSPVGDPEDKTDVISIHNDTGYSVYLEELSFDGDKQTKVGDIYSEASADSTNSTTTDSSSSAASKDNTIQRSDGTDANGLRTFTITMTLNNTNGGTSMVYYTFGTPGVDYVLIYGTNNLGTITTNCTPRGESNSDYTDYYCHTTFDTEPPTEESERTKTIRMYHGNPYTLWLREENGNNIYGGKLMF